MCTWTGAAPNIYRATEMVGAQIEGLWEHKNYWKHLTH